MSTMMYREMTSPLSERNGHRGATRERTWPELSENELLLKMQKKMAGLDSKQMKVIREYEQELDAMKSEIKKISTGYDGLRQKNSRYRQQLKDKNEQLKKLQDEHSRVTRHSTSEVWTSEKARLLAKIKQLEVEKKQADDECSSLSMLKDENSHLKRELESLKFRETMWVQEKERAEKERRRNKELGEILKLAEKPYQDESLPKSMDWSMVNNNKNHSFNFDEAWAQISQSPDLPFSSLPSMHLVSGYRESDDLQDIRKSLNEAREELKLGKGETQSKKSEFLKDLEERSRTTQHTTYDTKKEHKDTEADQVKQMIKTLESKISSLESNCLTEVRHLVHNVDVLKKELHNSQQELRSLKEYSRQMERRREEEKQQMLNESRELKLDLTSLRSEIRDKSQGSDRTDLSRGASSDTREPERGQSEENFENHYSPLVGFVGSRCNYLKMKLDTLKKHLKNLDVQTKTVLSQSLVETPREGEITQGDRRDSSAERKHTSKVPTLQRQSSHGDASKEKNQSSTAKKNDKGDKTSDENDDDDDGDILVVTPRPHRNRFDEEMDNAMVVVENGENIERLRLPSLEEEEDEDEEEEEGDRIGDKDEDTDEDKRKSERMEGGRQRPADRSIPSPRKRDGDSVRLEDEEEIVKRFLSREESCASSLVQQVDSRFQKLERELEMQSRRRSQGVQGHRRPMQAFHDLLPNSAH